MSKNFRIIATVKTPEQVEKVLKFPDTILRINSSHMETNELINFVSETTKKYPDIEIYIDLQGSKIRISRDQPQMKISLNQTLKLTADQNSKPNSENLIKIGNPNTIKLLQKGTKIKIDDGRMELEVLSIENDFNATAIVKKEGTIRPGKGFNLYPHPFVQNELSERDKEIVEKSKNFKNVKYALSFVSVPEEILDLKKRGNNKFIAAKIEREMSKEQLEKICEVTDSIWICRGDMGVQMGFVQMSKFVKNFTEKILPHLKIPCVIAGEVMEHFCEHSAPTRTEICYLGNCIADGYKGMVLSDETVFGKFAKEAMEFCYNYIKEYLEEEK